MKTVTTVNDDDDLTTVSTDVFSKQNIAIYCKTIAIYSPIKYKACHFNQLQYH